MNQQHHRKWLNKAIQLALKNPIKPRGRTSISRMAAVLTDGKYILATGLNKYKTHPLMYTWTKNHERICLHAEMDCLQKGISDWFGGWLCDVDLSKCEIYVARVLRDGTPALAKPCNACLGALTYYGIKDIHWTT